MTDIRNFKTNQLNSVFLHDNQENYIDELKQQGHKLIKNAMNITSLALLVLAIIKGWF